MTATLSFIILDGLVGDIPGVSPTPTIGLHIVLLGLATRLQVALVHERHANGKTMKRHVARLGEVEDTFIGHVHKPLGVDGLEVSVRHVSDADVLDPCELVLENKVTPKCIGHIHRNPRLCARIPYIQEERPIVGHDSFAFSKHIMKPSKIDVVGLSIVDCRTILDAQVVRR